MLSNLCYNGWVVSVKRVLASYIIPQHRNGIQWCPQPVSLWKSSVLRFWVKFRFSYIRELTETRWKEINSSTLLAGINFTCIQFCHCTKVACNLKWNLIRFLRAIARILYRHKSFNLSYSVIIYIFDVMFYLQLTTVSLASKLEATATDSKGMWISRREYELLPEAHA